MDASVVSEITARSRGSTGRDMMDSFELSKIAAGALLALLLVFGTKTAMEILDAGHGGHVAHGYNPPLPKKAAATAAGAPAAPAGMDFGKVVAAVATAKADAGQAAFKACAACHTATKDGKNLVGPNLWGIVGRNKASHEGFTYSDAMKSKGGAWTYEDLAHFIHAPGKFVPGTKMTFKGIADPAELADMLAYLRTLGNPPAALPGK